MLALPISIAPPPPLALHCSSVEGWCDGSSDRKGAQWDWDQNRVPVGPGRNSLPMVLRMVQVGSGLGGLEGDQVRNVPIAGTGKRNDGRGMLLLLLLETLLLLWDGGGCGG